MGSHFLPVHLEIRMPGTTLWFERNFYTTNKNKFMSGEETTTGELHTDYQIGRNNIFNLTLFMHNIPPESRH